MQHDKEKKYPPPKKKKGPQKRKKNAIFLKSEININHPKEQSKKHNKKQAKI